MLRPFHFWFIVKIQAGEWVVNAVTGSIISIPETHLLVYMLLHWQQTSQLLGSIHWNTSTMQSKRPKCWVPSVQLLAKYIVLQIVEQKIHRIELKVRNQSVTTSKVMIGCYFSLSSWELEMLSHTHKGSVVFGSLYKNNRATPHPSRTMYHTAATRKEIPQLCQYYVHIH